MSNKNQQSQKFIKLETISSKLLLSTTILALLLSNSPLYEYYFKFFHTDISIYLAKMQFTSNVLFLINDGLMTIFFLVVGLEIKYELLNGSLNTVGKAALPAIAATGGMIIPALIYFWVNRHDDIALRGWAIPTATDIAFALSILSFLSSKVPSALKAFLTALAILDDLAAIIIIAIFYTDHIILSFLGFALICISVLFILNKFGVSKLSIYILIGTILWFSFLKAGIHPTLSGIAVAFAVPLQHTKQSPLKRLIHLLHPWVALGIIPLFAFANAGVSFLHLELESLHVRIIVGVLLGLFIGKQIGVFGASWIAVKLRIASLPSHVKWSELYAVAIICGIGFTISLFIGTLAFGNYQDGYLNSVKIGVLGGSLLSGAVGYLLLLLLHNYRFSHDDAR